MGACKAGVVESGECGSYLYKGLEDLKEVWVFNELGVDPKKLNIKRAKSSENPRYTLWSQRG